MKPGCGVVACFFAVGLAFGVASLTADDKKDKKDAPKIEIKAVTLDELDKHIAAQKKTTAMDVWATWCIPCREKFPKFVSLSEKYKGKASFFSLSLDEEDQLAAAKRFLEGKKAVFANFLAKDGPEAVEKKFGFEGVPQYVVWNANGKIILRTDDVAELEKKLKEIFPEKKGDA